MSALGGEMPVEGVRMDQQGLAQRAVRDEESVNAVSARDGLEGDARPVDSHELAAQRALQPVVRELALQVAQVREEKLGEGNDRLRCDQGLDGRSRCGGGRAGRRASRRLLLLDRRVVLARRRLLVGRDDVKGH